ncbi:MAG: T9SS type A sorting domain-containing protein [Chitinophagaceae bacterium]|nr:T9SS type A sorting domain-containing protein [Chitinophagaceae bacterium]
MKFNKGSVVQVSVYPNPVKDKLQVSIQSDNIRLQLADMNGRIIKDQVLQVGNHEWSLRDYSPGIYMLSVLQNNQRIETIKIIKQ